MSKKRSEKSTADIDSPALGSSLLLFGWIALLLLVVVDPAEKGTGTYRRGHGGLLWGNTLVFLILFLRRNDLSSMLRAARRVLRSPFSSTWADYEELCFTACVVGATITTIFVVDFGGADVLAVRTGIVAFLISLKVAFDRWRASKRKK